MLQFNEFNDGNNHSYTAESTVRPQTNCNHFFQKDEVGLYTGNQWCDLLMEKKQEMGKTNLSIMQLTQTEMHIHYIRFQIKAFHQGVQEQEHQDKKQSNLWRACVVKVWLVFKHQ